MLTILIATAVALLPQGTTVGPEKTAVMVPVHQFVDGFNKGDTKAALAACADETSIIDEFPPHEWHGAGACAKWMTDFDADAKKNGIADGVLTLTTPLHVDISGDRAYVVMLANYAFKRNGTPMKETGSMFTFALQKSQSGWRITGWAWAKH
jgi:ketosteroid isomerase-like protein